MKINRSAKIYVTGHNGMFGTAMRNYLKAEGFTNIISAPSNKLDARNQQAVNAFFEKEKPEYVIHSAAKVGGIYASSRYKADFFYDNMLIAVNVIHASKVHAVKKLLFLGSSCVYPKLVKQPVIEEGLLTGSLEPTNESYAIAKIAGLKMCDYYREQFGCDFISIMPPNIYGPNDKYDLKNAHVIPALIRKFHEAKISNAKQVEVWGTGKAVREFLHVDDLANACLFLIENYSDYGHVNSGVGYGTSIAELALILKEVVGFNGEIVYNTDYPDGTPVKIQNINKITELGWVASIHLKDGLKSVYADWLSSES